MAVITDAIEGIVNDRAWFHYDLTNDVLYLRLADERDTPAHGEEIEGGSILLRAEDDDRPVGMTIVNYWAKFVGGPKPDSIQELTRTIEPWANKLAA